MKYLCSDIASFLERKYGVPHSTENGTRLYGHSPSVAPKAYEAIVYPGLKKNDIIEFSNRLGSSLPEQYHKFLLAMNGLSLHIGKVRLFGYLPAKRSYPVHPHYYPSNLIQRSRVLSDPMKFCIGWTQDGDRYIYIQKDKVIVGNGKNAGETYRSIFDFVLDQYSPQGVSK